MPRQFSQLAVSLCLPASPFPVCVCPVMNHHKKWLDYRGCTKILWVSYFCRRNSPMQKFKMRGPWEWNEKMKKEVGNIKGMGQNGRTPAAYANTVCLVWVQLLPPAWVSLVKKALSSAPFCTNSQEQHIWPGREDQGPTAESGSGRLAILLTHHLGKAYSQQAQSTFLWKQK